MTPKQLGRRFEAARLKSVDDYRRDVTQAWNFARCYAMVKSKKGLPPLKKLLEEVKDKDAIKGDRQDAKQIKSALSVLSQQYGIPLRKAPK